VNAIEICERNRIKAAEARQARDVGMQQVAEHAGRPWVDEAYSALRAFAMTRSGLGAWSGEDAVDYCHDTGLREPTDLRAWGAVFTRAQRALVIERSKELFQRRRGHATMSPGWVTV
jgi:hypothetical protein